MKNVLKYLLLALIAVSQLFACGGSDDDENVVDENPPAVEDNLPEESDREIANLLEVRDHYPKYVVTLDELAAGNINGVRIVHLADFLLAEDY